jgi:Tfp pilus assembly protein PilZ
MADKRKDQRIKKRLMVSFNDDGLEGLGLTSNISESGMCITSESGFSSEDEIELSIAVPGEVFQLKGKVMWCTESTDKADSIPDDIGIKIIEAPPEYQNYIEFVKRHSTKTEKTDP